MVNFSNITIRFIVVLACGIELKQPTGISDILSDDEDQESLHAEPRNVNPPDDEGQEPLPAQALNVYPSGDKGQESLPAEQLNVHPSGDKGQALYLLNGVTFTHLAKKASVSAC